MFLKLFNFSTEYKSFSFLTQKTIVLFISSSFFSNSSSIAIIGASHVPVAIKTLSFFVSFK
ncbi:MAG: hypothetical protein P1U46_03255 [Patescibacteria group bacterium]|nr:hypothetical protein [Patescibacteria group bacterium]